MEALRIGRMRALYRVANRGDGERLNRVLSLTLSDYLEHALHGVSPYEEICVRDVSTRVKLRMNQSDDSLAAAWSLALAEVIREAALGKGHIGAGGRIVYPDLIRYSSRAHALVDMADCVARGDLRRSWAWKQLGLWSTATPASDVETWRETARALVHSPEAIVPVIGELARRGRLAEFARKLEPDAWLALAVAAAAAANCKASPDELLRAPREPRAGYDELSSGTAANTAILRVTRIAPVLIHYAAPEVVAVFAILEANPAALGGSKDQVLGLVADVTADLRAISPEQSAIAPEQGERPSRPSIATGEDADIAGSDAAGDEPEPVRQYAYTQFGGLLFLMGLVADLVLVDQLSDAMPERPLRWTLHLLAGCLTQAPSDDPAVLAFAGLRPEDTPPDEDTSPVIGQERAHAEAAANAIADELEARLPELESRGSDLVRFVCQRSAQVVADPGWIEVHFPHEEVSTELRKAGLDLDPGYLPWLGVVVRFVYE